MKKLFIVLCVVIMFFGIVGCPSSNDPVPLSKSSFTSTPTSTSDLSGITIDTDDTSGSPGASPVPEPATLILLGSGLVGLAGVGRKKFFKKD